MAAQSVKKPRQYHLRPEFDPATSPPLSLSTVSSVRRLGGDVVVAGAGATEVLKWDWRGFLLVLSTLSAS